MKFVSTKASERSCARNGSSRASRVRRCAGWPLADNLNLKLRAFVAPASRWRFAVCLCTRGNRRGDPSAIVFRRHGRRHERVESRRTIGENSGLVAVAVVVHVTTCFRRRICRRGLLGGWTQSDRVFGDYRRLYRLRSAFGRLIRRARGNCCTAVLYRIDGLAHR